MQNDVLLKRLKTFEFLQDLEQEALAHLAEKSLWKIFPPSAIIFWEGDIESNLYYLQYGSLKLVKSSPGGRQQALRFINAGDVFNEIGVLARRPNPVTAIALEESGLWFIPRDALEEAIIAHPHVALQIISNMADKMISLVSFAADLSLKSVEGRFIKLLLDQAEGDIIPRRKWTNQVELAAHLGTVPDVLSRIIREMTKSGLIEMDKQKIRILDRKKLEARLENSG